MVSASVADFARRWNVINRPGRQVDNPAVAIVFRPDWTWKAARLFKRATTGLEALPIGVVVFPGSGISGHLAGQGEEVDLGLVYERRHHRRAAA